MWAFEYDIWVVTLVDCSDGEDDATISVFSNREEACKMFRDEIKTLLDLFESGYSKKPVLFDEKHPDAHLEDPVFEKHDTEDGGKTFSIWKSGYYTDDHVFLKMEKKKVQTKYIEKKEKK